MSHKQFLYEQNSKLKREKAQLRKEKEILSRFVERALPFIYLGSEKSYKFYKEIKEYIDANPSNWRKSGRE